MLVDEAQPGTTKKATSTSVWLRAVTDFSEDQNLDISFAHCLAEELNEFLSQFYSSLKHKKAGTE